jgi:CRISPR-associated protein Csc2
MSTLEQYKEHVLPQYSNFPKGKYVTLITVRKTESETILRTEGSGEGLTKEFVRLGIQPDNQAVMQRVIISKRKQVAAERRTGRELLRENNLLFAQDNNEEKYGICALNRNHPCEQCIDCMVYGYAVGGGGAQKSRVITEDAFSLLPVAVVTGKRTSNALFDNGTMRDPVTNKASASIYEEEYVKPETHFLDLETLKDVTLGELRYVLGNLLRTRRYGAISSRAGKVKNTLVGMVFSNCEIFSNLELTQKTYDLLKQKDPELNFPLKDADVEATAYAAMQELIREIPTGAVVLSAQEVKNVQAEIIELFGDAANTKKMLDDVTAMYKSVQ